MEHPTVRAPEPLEGGAAVEEPIVLQGGDLERPSVAFMPDGKSLVSSDGHRRVRIGDLSTAEQTTTIDLFGPGSTSLAVSPDGRTIAVGRCHGSPADSSPDGIERQREWYIRRFDLETRIEKPPFIGEGYEGFQILFAPDGKSLACSRSGGFVLRDAVTGMVTAVHKAPSSGPFFLAFSPDSKLVACVSDSGGLGVWDSEPGESRLIIDRFSVRISRIRSLAISPDSTTLAVGSWDHSIKLWDLTTGLEKDTHHEFENGTRNLDGVLDLRFSADGKTLISVHRDQQVRYWDTHTFKIQEKIVLPLAESYQVCSLELSDDGTFIAAVCEPLHAFEDYLFRILVWNLEKLGR